MVLDTCKNKQGIIVSLLVVVVLAILERNTDSMILMRRMDVGEEKDNATQEFDHQSSSSEILNLEDSGYFLRGNNMDTMYNDGVLSTESEVIDWDGIHDLRFDWSNLQLYSEIAKRLYEHQNNCLLPVRKYEWRGDSGLGSDIHVWGNSLWAGLLYGHRVKSPNPWLWVDVEACGGSSSWQCYFPGVEPACTEEEFQNERILAGDCGKKRFWPNTYSIPAFRAAVTEFVFSRLSSVVVTEARRQLNAIFGNNGVPSNLITVHVRWGDKILEGSQRNIPIKDYIAAVHKLTKEKNIDSVHVLLCTEDPRGVIAFNEAAPTYWNIYLDHFYTEFLPFRENREVTYNIPSIITKELNGKPGLWALGSLIVAMEANHFVLGTTSNWSRLMNELRKNVLDPRCGNCTTLIDLEEGEC
jgi:hypothetical protein